nr:6307_t:CDS:2 [Entrophospora candida]
MSNFRAIPFSKANANNSNQSLEVFLSKTRILSTASILVTITHYHLHHLIIHYLKNAENFNSIDISAKLLNNSDEIRVSLLDRDTEMKELFIINKDYFDGVKQFISDNNGATCNTWQEFLSLLYSKREEISDKKWMKCIEINDDNIYHDNAYLDQFYKDNYYYQNNNFIDVTLIRDFPKILENFESSYPQFFVNLKQTLDKESTNNSNNDEQEEKTPYEEFKNILLKSRNEMTDIEWEESIYNILNPYPRLIEQFEEIIAYEISEE